MASYSTVSFDIDNTLVDFRAMLESALQAVAHYITDVSGQSVSITTLQGIRNELVNDPQWIGASLETLRKESVRRMFIRLDLNPDIHLNTTWQIFLDSRRPQEHLYADVVDNLDHLRQRGIRLVAASNGNTPLRQSSIAHYFQDWFFAADIGIAKPALGFYQTIICRLSESPQQILHIGDSWQEDYCPALACGIGALLLCRNQSHSNKTAQTIYSLHELPHYLS
jgi:putative hydrolase of the HAD superfamily